MTQMTLKAARVNAGFSQKKVAEAVGVTPATIYNWEAGKTPITVRMANRLSGLYGVPMDDIFFDDKSN